MDALTTVPFDTFNGATTGPSKDTISDSTKIIGTSFAFDFKSV